MCDSFPSEQITIDASWKGVAVGGPRLELWRAPTDNDRGASQGSYEVADPALTGGRGGPAPSSVSRWLQHGLDRLTHRFVSVARTSAGLVQRVKVGAANSGAGVDVTHTWTLTDTGLLLRTEVVPFGGWESTWPRVGVRIDLPSSFAGAPVEWFGTGPEESYADS